MHLQLRMIPSREDRPSLLLPLMNTWKEKKLNINNSNIHDDNDYILNKMKLHHQMLGYSNLLPLQQTIDNDSIIINYMFYGPGTLETNVSGLNNCDLFVSHENLCFPYNFDELVESGEIKPAEVLKNNLLKSDIINFNGWLSYDQSLYINQDLARRVGFRGGEIYKGMFYSKILYEQGNYKQVLFILDPKDITEQPRVIGNLASYCNIKKIYDAIHSFIINLSISYGLNISRKYISLQDIDIGSNEFGLAYCCCPLLSCQLVQYNIEGSKALHRL